MRPAARPAPAPAWGRWLLRFGLAFGGLNALLSFDHVEGGLGVGLSTPRLSFELCLAVLALMAWVAWRGRPSERALGWLAAGFLVLVAARYLDVTVPAVFGRPLNLYWDGRHGLQVLRLALEQVPAWRMAAALAAAALGLWLLHRLVRLGLGQLAWCLSWHRPRPVLLAGGLALSASFAAHPHVERDTRWFFSLPLAPTLARQAARLPTLLAPGIADAALGAGPDFSGSLGALRGADVLLLFAESYGVTTLDDPALVEALQPRRERLQAAIGAGGRAVVSARVRSPTFGGGSWLAHAALLSGLDTSDPAHHDRLMASSRPTLVGHFRRHGYRTVGWMPGLQRPWPEGAFYGFDRLAGLDGIGYAGPAFGFWQVPDQAALALLREQEWAPPAAPGGRLPRFIVFPTLTTHAPFRPLPPYQPDWSRLTGPQAYARAQLEAALAQAPSWREARSAYAEAMRYQFDWLAGWFDGPAPRGLVTVVVGDHQPLAAVSGPRASWDVPVHVIAEDPVLLQRLIARGFEPGLAPSPAAGLGGLHRLTALLLEVFDGSPVPGERAVAAPAAPSRSPEASAEHRRGG